MPRKSFSVAAAVEPISFDLTSPVSGNAVLFVCRDRMAAGKLMRFAELFSSIQEESESGEAETAKQGALAIPAIRDFFNAALMPNDRDKFWTMIDSDEEGIPLDTLVEIAGWLAEVYSGGRPTGTTSEPGSGVTSSGGGSPASQSPVAIETYSRSEPTPSLT
jgi:hypothetical protein